MLNGLKEFGVAMLFVAGMISTVFCQTDKKDEGIIKGIFGKMPDGTAINSYILKNSKGMEAKIINYGAIVVSLKVPDKEGKFEDVVLGYDDLAGYEADKSYFGGIVGRYGNRIGKGKMTIDGKSYQLATNNGENHLHGGMVGFNKRIWKVENTIMTKEGPAITLSIESKDGEENYPGNVKLTVVYTLTNDNALSIVYSGNTDKATVLNPTNHSYFNLSGDMNKTILTHELMIAADKYTPVDEGLITTGVLENTSDTPMDFRKAKAVGKDIWVEHRQLKFGLGYDHNWVINGFDKKVKLIATLYEPHSGRFMEQYSDQPGVQFYSGNFLDGKVKGKKGVMYNHRTGLCLEAQHFPDSPNKPQFPSTLLMPGQTYHQTTIYKFSVK